VKEFQPTINHHLSKYEILTDEFIKNKTKITKQKRINIINQIYNIVHNEFYEIRHHYHQRNSEKEEAFIHLLKSLQESGEVLLDELTEPDNQDIKSSKALKRIVVKTRNKINNYIDTYNNEKKEAFILLSSKIGIDIVKHVTSYL
jgi:hypothetical protein